ncbi:MAG: circadian clock protein KaiC, partial [Candidatus Obscuribacterales bacterium]|nr:circadian clock protein KaiC [Candidatus Obscuribacterales bacterium]
MNEKLPTGINGFDHIAHGGLPKGRSTLVTGSAGSAKTLFATQFLAMGIIKYNQPGVFVTFEETPADIRTNVKAFGWDIESWEKEGKWLFVDISPDLEHETFVHGEFELSAIIARIRHAVGQSKAQRLVMDSVAALFAQVEDARLVRRELFAIAAELKRLNLTSIITSERNEESEEISSYGVEEFVADNVVILRNNLEQEKRRRTIEILKFRGAPHEKGECPFTVLEKAGLAFIPLSFMELTQASSTQRIRSGIQSLDKMCYGGFFRDSIVLISGATGTGKSLTVSHFVNGGAESGEKSMVFAFEESRDQLFRNATGWGMDFAKHEKSGNLFVQCKYPETAGLEEHLFWMQNEIDRVKPNRVAIDSLSALERISLPKAFREFVLCMTAFLKEREIAGLFTAATPALMGGESITEAHISTITDSIILLRYVELNGEM